MMAGLVDNQDFCLYQTSQQRPIGGDHLRVYRRHKRLLVSVCRPGAKLTHIWTYGCAVADPAQVHC